MRVSAPEVWSGQRAHVLDFPPGEPDGSEIGGIQGKELGWRGHPAAKVLLQPAGDGPRRVAGNLLADDRVDKHAEGIAERPPSAPGFRVDWFRGIDEPRKLSIAGLQRGQRALPSGRPRPGGDRPIV